MENKGEIREGEIPYLLMELDRKKWTGILFLEKEKIKKEFYIKNGMIGYSRSNLLSETLGRVMLFQGLIKAEEHQKALEIMEKKKIKWGEALKELGYKGDISNAFRIQIEMRIKDIFRWKKGRWEIFEKEVVEDKFPFWSEMDMVYLISRGISAMDETFFMRERERFLNSSYIMGVKDHRVRIPPSVEKLLNGEFFGRDFVSAIGDERKGLRALYFFEVVGIMKRVGEVQKKQKDVFIPQDEREIYNRLLEKFNFLKSASLFERLGVEKNASINEIKEKYYALAKEFHPDRFHTYKSEAIRDLADRIFTLINDAYNTLSDPQKREEYISFADESTSFTFEKKEDIVAAETQFQKAEILDRRGDLKGALEFYTWAYKLNPKEPLYMAKMGWTLYRVGKREKDIEKVKEGMKHVFKAHSLSPQNDTIAYLVASVYRAEGDYKKTVEFLEKTLTLNPSHEQARRELNILKRKERI
jgi:curved DNA-binding protein CbpA